MLWDPGVWKCLKYNCFESLNPWEWELRWAAITTTQNTAKAYPNLKCWCNMRSIFFIPPATPKHGILEATSKEAASFHHLSPPKSADLWAQDLPSSTQHVCLARLDKICWEWKDAKNISGAMGRNLPSSLILGDSPFMYAVLQLYLFTSRSFDASTQNESTKLTKQPKMIWTMNKPV